MSSVQITTIQDFNPNKIVLTKDMKKLFVKLAKECKKAGYIELDEKVASRLIFQSLIKRHQIGRDKERNSICEEYELDVFGELYYEHLLDEKRNLFLNSIRWWIATIIAIFALIISCVSLGWQIYSDIQENAQSKNPDIHNEVTDNTIDNSEIRSNIQNSK